MKLRENEKIVEDMMILACLMPVLICVLAQAQDSRGFKSNEVRADGSVTFRYKDPTAHQVLLQLDGASDPLPMQRADDGLWSLSTGPLSPNIYEYGFLVDGREEIDPSNPVIVPNLLNRDSEVAVPGNRPQLWEAQQVPHGVVHHHFYSSTIVAGLREGQSEYYVYTPPKYEAKRRKPYPVLYLLHGWSDEANAWIEVGRANLVLDNLIASGKVQPMVVVMPLGYGDMSFVTSGREVWHDDASVKHNVDLFTQALLTEVLPKIESEYRVSKKREDRAIAGLSMGGLESLTIGLSNPAQFAWVGAFSSAAEPLEKNEQIGKLTGKTDPLRLLWIACGTEDQLITPNRKFIAELKAKEIPVTAIETPGMHSWMVWRDNLAHFTPLLFQRK